MRERRDRRVIDILNITLTVFVFALAVMLVFVRTHAQEQVKQTVAIQNAPPKVDSVVASMTPGGGPVDLFFLTSGKMTPLYVWGRVSDPNGCMDLHDVAIKVYRTDLGSKCTETPGLCVSVSNLSIEGCAGGFGDAAYAGVIDLPYFSDPTDTGSASEAQDWSAQVTVTDKEGAQGERTSDPFDVASIAAMDADDHLDFGLLSLGATTPPVALHLTNLGNRPFNFQAESYGALSCNGAASLPIPAEDLHLSLAHETSFEQSVAMIPPTPVIDTSPAANADQASGLTANTADQTSAPNANTRVPYYIAQPVQLPANVPTRLTGGGTAQIYFLLRVPTEGIDGTCSGSMGITAIPE